MSIPCQEVGSLSLSISSKQAVLMEHWSCTSLQKLTDMWMGIHLPPGDNVVNGFRPFFVVGVRGGGGGEGWGRRIDFSIFQHLVKAAPAICLCGIVLGFLIVHAWLDPHPSVGAVPG